MMDHQGADVATLAAFEVPSISRQVGSDVLYRWRFHRAAARLVA